MQSGSIEQPDNTQNETHFDGEVQFIKHDNIQISSLKFSNSKSPSANDRTPKEKSDSIGSTPINLDKKLNKKLLYREVMDSTCSFFPFEDEHFYEHVVKYNNNKLFWPGVCGVHKGQGSSFRKNPGEVIKAELSCEIFIHAVEEFLPGQIVLTNYRLLFLPFDHRYLIERHFRSDYFSIPLVLIASIRKSGERKSKFSSVLEIFTKCGRKFRLAFTLEDGPAASKLTELLDKMVPLPKLASHFAFAFHAKCPEIEEKYKGWSVYNMAKEFFRQGVTMLSDTPILQGKTINEEAIVFQRFRNATPDNTLWVCDSYPPEVVVPVQITPEEIIRSAKFRVKNRFPALVYCYKRENEGCIATLWRSSQCHSGFAGKRSLEDELFLRFIGNTNKKTGKEGRINLHIYDARPFLNAMANKVNGKGFENLSYYWNVEMFFLQIDNIHSVRDKHKKLVELSASLNPNKLTSSLDYSGWVCSLTHLLAGAKDIVERSLKKGMNVLIHCSDGWDRTTQLISLAQLMLDPYYRTIEGFQVLIEKDWISFGHLFKSRSGWKPNSPFEEDKRSPIFIQFLDCVHQLQNQFPAEFEFNLRFLTDIGYYSRTGFFGTFLCDNYEEIIKHNVQETTTSIWSFINANKEMYKSLLHSGLNQHPDMFRSEIVPDTSLINMRFWREFFCFYARNALEEEYKNVELDSKIDLYEITLAMQMNKTQTLKNEQEELSQKIKNLTAELEKLKGKQSIPASRGNDSTTESQTPLEGETS